MKVYTSYVDASVIIFRLSSTIMEYTNKASYVLLICYVGEKDSVDFMPLECIDAYTIVISILMSFNRHEVPDSIQFVKTSLPNPYVMYVEEPTNLATGIVLFEELLKVIPSVKKPNFFDANENVYPLMVYTTQFVHRILTLKDLASVKVPCHVLLCWIMFEINKGFPSVDGCVKSFFSTKRDICNEFFKNHLCADSYKVESLPGFESFFMVNGNEKRS